MNVTPDVFTTFFVMTFGFDIDSTPAQSALRALDLGAKFQIVAIRILRETEGLKEIRGTTKGTFRYNHFINDLQMYEITTSLC